MFQKKLLCIALIIVGKVALVQPKVCPDEYAETGQINVLVVWNGNISNGDTLPYCHARTNCTIEFRAISMHSPSMAIGGGCYAVGEMNDTFPGSVMDKQHPDYSYKFPCASIKHLRLVFSQTEYTKEYKLESSNVLCNGTLATTATDGTSSGSPPSSTTTVTPSNSRTVGIYSAIGTIVTLALFILLIVIVVILWRRRKRSMNSDHSASYSSGGNDTSSSICERGNSMRRDDGDGEEETTHPISVSATNGNGIMKMVTGKG